MHLFKEGEHWKVEPGPLGVETLVVQRIVPSSRNVQKENILMKWLSTNLLIFWDCSVVDQSVIVEEEPASDVEGDEDVDAVVLMGGKDKEDAEAVEQPGKRV